MFSFFYFRAQRLATENDALLGVSREEASTDELTRLGNRRSLTEDLRRAFATSREATGEEVLLAIYDLDGFKQYNDTFGHAAGDALLVRLGGRLLEPSPAWGRPTAWAGTSSACSLAAP